MIGVSSPFESLPQSVYSRIVQYQTVFEVTRLRQLNQSFRFKVDSEHWLEICVASGGVTEPERPSFWLNYCGNVDLIVLQEWFNIHQGNPNRLTLDIPQHVARESIFSYWASAPLSKEKQAEINRDVSRTLPTHSFFAQQSGQHALYSVLTAVSACEPSIGYCQGMNFIAATLLLHLKSPADAFCMLLALLRHYHYRFVFAARVPLLPLRVYQFSQIVRAELPTLWHHLNSCSYSVEVIAQQWVMTLFGYFLPTTTLGKVWDRFLLKGWTALFELGLSLLHAMESDLLALEVEGISGYMQGSRKQSHKFFDLDKLKLFSVDEGTLVDLAKQFQSEQLLAAAKEVENMEILDEVGVITPLHTLGFCLECVEQGKLVLAVDLAGLSSCNRPLEGVEIPQGFRPSRVVHQKLSFAPDELTAHVSPEATILRLPVQVLQGMRENVRLADSVTSQDVWGLSEKISSIEKKLNKLCKARDGLINQYEVAAREFAEVADKKRLRADQLQDLVISEDHARETSVPLTHSSLYSPKRSFIRSFRQPETQVGRVLSALAEVERLYHEKRKAMDNAQVSLREIDSECAELTEVKSLYIRQMVDFTSAMEKKRREIVWRYLTGAAEAFGVVN